MIIFPTTGDHIFDKWLYFQRLVIIFLTSDYISNNWWSYFHFPFITFHNTMTVPGYIFREPADYISHCDFAYWYFGILAMMKTILLSAEDDHGGPNIVVGTQFPLFGFCHWKHLHSKAFILYIPYCPMSYYHISPLPILSFSRQMLKKLWQNKLE